MDSFVKDERYIVIQGFMLSKLKLKGNELLIYAIIHGFPQGFTGSLQYLCDWTNSTKKTVQMTLKSLIDQQLVEKKEQTSNNVKFCTYYAKNYPTMVKNTMGYGKNYHTHSKNYHTPMVIFTPPTINKLDNNIANNLTLGGVGGNVPMDEMFNTFWDEYPKKTYKEQAKAIFTSINPDITTFNAMLAGLKLWKSSEQWTKSDGQYITAPTKWLREKLWTCNHKPSQSQQCHIHKPSQSQQYKPKFDIHSLGTHSTDKSDPSMVAYLNKVQAFLKRNDKK